MAQDITRDDLNFQKRGVSVAVIPLVSADIDETSNSGGSTVVNIPERSLITSVIVNVNTVDSGTGTILVTDGTNNIAAAIDINAAAEPVVGTLDQTYTYMATGGSITVVEGTDVTGGFVGDLVIEYIELDKTTGEYTEL